MTEEHETIEQEYWDKSGDTIIIPTNFTRNEHGFASYSIEGEVLIIGNVYGDGGYWRDFFNDKAKENGCTRLRFATRRNPEAWNRKYEFECVGWILEKDVE